MKAVIDCLDGRTGISLVRFVQVRDGLVRADDQVAGSIEEKVVKLGRNEKVHLWVGTRLDGRALATNDRSRAAFWVADGRSRS